MRFSIVTPVLNGMPWLPQCVESVAAQRSTASVEHIVLDAGSIDGSREWLSEHQHQYGLQTIFQPDDGQTDALAQGFARATGDILGWLNADDVLEPAALLRVEHAFDDNLEIVLVSGCCIFMDANGEFVSLKVPPRADTYDRLRLQNRTLPQPATFFRADAYRRSGGLDCGYHLAMDVDLWLKLARIGHVVYLREEILARFRVHPAAKSRVTWPGSIREHFAIKRRHGLPIRSEAGLWFLYHGYIAPLLSPAKRRLKRALKAFFLR